MSRRLLALSSQVVNLSLAPLAAGLSLDVCFVAWVIARSGGVGIGAGIAVAAVLVGPWFVLPWVAGRRARRRPA